MSTEELTRELAAHVERVTGKPVQVPTTPSREAVEMGEHEDFIGSLLGLRDEEKEN